MSRETVAPDATPATEGPNEPSLGHAFLTLVEPHVGWDREYNEWYDDDHFHAGAMVLPWWFSGRRWVATRELRELRESSDPDADLDRGWSFATYWITRGRLADQARWLEAAVARLVAEGRMFAERTHVRTAFHDLVGEWQASGHEPRGMHALEYPYAGLVLEVLGGGQRVAGAVESYVAPRLARGEAAQCLAFAAVAWPGRNPPAYAAERVSGDGETVLLWFTERSPRDGWADTFGTHRAAAESAGGRLVFLGGFVPTLPGSNALLAQVR